MSWDSTYQDHQRVWGDRPSALAAFACRYLQGKPCKYTLEILDIGCGYGRDAFYLAGSIDCRILGIDNSDKAIEMAKKSLSGEPESRIRFECCDFDHIAGGQFDIVLASNFYHLFETAGRKNFVAAVKKRLKRGGLLFLSTLSHKDPEHFGKGKRIETEENSYQDEKFLHFCTRKELEKDFRFLDIKELSEREYFEPRSNGEVHHHILWILVGYKSNGY
jgi:cyclopropane fatty-acyl-phospholipid synthase-like methyltransferase